MPHFTATDLLLLGQDGEDTEQYLGEHGLAGYAAYEAASVLARNWADYASDGATLEQLCQAIDGDIAALAQHLTEWANNVVVALAEQEGQL